MASSSSSSHLNPASSSSRSWKYDVFLSFREDTLKTFVDHLYSALVERTIRTYKDDATLPMGDAVGPSLMNAIQESQIAVVIFSENYADSLWCLEELEHIMKCRHERGQIVLPVFYNVDPSDVRKQKRKYEEAFAKHERSENNKNKVESWKKALVDASNIAGWEPKHVANGHEAKCIREIVDSILVKLSSLASAVEDEDLVGMGTPLKDLKRILRIGSGGVRMVGIWGLGGRGKTTLATSLYLELKVSGHFDGCCFVENIREESKQQNGLKSLQEKFLLAVFDKKMQVESVDIGKHTIKQMLCRRNVLIVLDDVDDLEQLEALAGRHDWFGDGSRIIITTRNEQVLISHRVDEVYPVSLLSRDEAIRLFRRHAYHADIPVQDYEKLSLRVIYYVNGLPLALKILGSFLYGKEKIEWISTLARLKDHPVMDIVENLKISYDGLKDVEKELFLDIACFFRGKLKDDAMEILDARGSHPCIGVKVLIQKALITISSDGRFDMHDLVQEMGHYIVRGEHPNNPEKHSRIWRSQDIEDICSRDATIVKENNKTEVIKYTGCSSCVSKLISNMKRLKLLQVFDHPFVCHLTHKDVKGPNSLSNELRYIHWTKYPASPLPENFQPTKLVVLKLHHSLQEELWKSKKYLPSLKVLDLHGSEILIRTPDFAGLPILETLVLSGCIRLKEIHPSIGCHERLVYVNLDGCDKLQMFPTFDKMKRLETLILSDCSQLQKLPEIQQHMDSLTHLHLDESGIEVLPSSIGRFCTNLETLVLSGCSRLKEIHPSIECHERLVYVDLVGCNKLQMFPTFDKMKSLETLQLSHCYQLQKLPEIQQHMYSLKHLHLDECGIEVLPSSVGKFCINLETLVLSGCRSLEEIHSSFGFLVRLVYLNLDGCDKLQMFPPIIRMKSLETLILSGCSQLRELPEIRQHMDSLKHLNLEWSGIEVLPSSIGEFCTNLVSINLIGCNNFRSIECNFRLFKQECLITGGPLLKHLNWLQEF